FPPRPISVLFPYTTLFRSRNVRLLIGFRLMMSGPIKLHIVEPALRFFECDGFTGQSSKVRRARFSDPRRFLSSRILRLILAGRGDRKSTRLNSSHLGISYA